TSTPIPTATRTPTPVNTLTQIPTPTHTSIPTTIPNTPIPTNTIIVLQPTNTPIPQCPERSKGDANCDGVVNLVDYACFVGELSNRKPTNCISADFNNTGGRTNAQDYAIWLTTYKRERGL
ncbi:MAG TPA: hypothetical protein PLS49_04745, partial [Candidatus Woesebacteria bacterium]|nr:hypothetical protein [Candidatus Woesebacteria bacterium]